MIASALGIHHVGLAVTDMALAIERYTSTLGASVDHEALVVEQGVHAVALTLPSGPFLELLAPLGDDTPVGRFLERRGEGIHHVAYEVRGIQGHLDRLAAEGIQLIDSTPRTGLFGLQVAFIHPESLFGVLAELVEPRSTSHV